MHRRTLLAGLASAPLAQALDWPQWRGPARTGISAETGLLDRWPEGGPPRVWKRSGLGAGFSSFAVAGGRIYTQGQGEGKQYVMALAATTGEMLWKTENGGAYDDRRGDGPRGTPTLHGTRAYALSAQGNLACVESTDGKVVWAKDLFREYGARNIHWGISESPLIDEGRLIVNAGGNGASVVALEPETGEEIWRTGSDRAGYSSAVVAEIDGLRTYIVMTHSAAIGVRADNGELLWRYEKASNGTANAATPIFHDNHVFVSSDYGTGCALLKLTRNGGGVSAEEVYFSRDMRNHYNTSVLIDGVLYGFSSRILTAMRWETGEVLWRDRSVGKGQVIAAQGDLYLHSEEGVVGLAEANPSAYREKSRFSYETSGWPTWALPVVADGRLYVRDQSTLYAYDISAGSES